MKYLDKIIIFNYNSIVLVIDRRTWIWTYNLEERNKKYNNKYIFQPITQW